MTKELNLEQLEISINNPPLTRGIRFSSLKLENFLRNFPDGFRKISKDSAKEFLTISTFKFSQNFSLLLIYLQKRFNQSDIFGDVLFNYFYKFIEENKLENIKRFFLDTNQKDFWKQINFVFNKLECRDINDQELLFNVISSQMPYIFPEVYYHLNKKNTALIIEYVLTSESACLFTIPNYLYTTKISLNEIFDIILVKERTFFLTGKTLFNFLISYSDPSTLVCFENENWGGISYFSETKRFLSVAKFFRENIENFETFMKKEFEELIWKDLSKNAASRRREIMALIRGKYQDLDGEE